MSKDKRENQPIQWGVPFGFLLLGFGVVGLFIWDLVMSGSTQAVQYSLALNGILQIPAQNQSLLNGVVIFGLIGIIILFAFIMYYIYKKQLGTYRRIG